MPLPPRTLRRALVAGAIALPAALTAGAVGTLTSFSVGDVADPAAVNGNFSALKTAVDDNDARLDHFTFAAGNVGVGTTPTATFESAGGIKIGNDELCDGTKGGTLRWTGSQLEVCNGTHWVYVAGASRGAQQNPASSCLDVKNTLPLATSGPYWIDPDGAGAGTAFQVWCDLAGASSGWTLILKAASTVTTFGYTSTHWTSATTVAGALDPSVDADMKSQAFNTLPFTSIRFCLNTQSNCLEDAKAAANAIALFSAASSTVTPMSRAQFMAWDPTADSTFSGETNCNAIGYLHSGGYAKCRFGIALNNENDCASNNSSIGFGCQDAYNAYPVSAGAAYIGGAYRYAGWVWVR